MVWIISKLYGVNGELNGFTQDRKGNFYVIVNSKSVYEINLESKITEIISVPNAWLHGIICIDGTLYFADARSHVILSFAIPSSKFSTFAGGGEGYRDGSLSDAMFSWIGGVTKDNKGHIYVTDDHHVRRINRAKQTVVTIAGCTEGETRGCEDGDALQAIFCSPEAITISDNGTIYVLDRNNMCIREIWKDTVYTLQVRQGNLWKVLSIGQGSAIWIHSSSGTLFCSDSHKIHIINTTESKVSTFTNSQLSHINCFHMDLAGDLYVAAGTSIFKVENSWKWERVLWIGHLKEDESNCLRTTPKDIFREIIGYVRLLFVEEERVLSPL